MRQTAPQAIHSCAVKFPEVAGSVVHVLMDFLGDANTGRRPRGCFLGNGEFCRWHIARGCITSGRSTSPTVQAMKSLSRPARKVAVQSVFTFGLATVAAHVCTRPDVRSLGTGRHLLRA